MGSKINTLKKIVVIGPESTGKSTLCRQLAEHYETIWVPEYARAYLETNGTKYNFEDLELIAAGQIKAEENAVEQCEATNAEHIFIDTDLYVMKVWSEFVFNKCDNRILTDIAQRSYDLYLLCDVDLPWQKDELREYPDLEPRKKLFHYYKDAMINQRIPWAVINGNYEERLERAVAAVNML